MYTNTLPQLHLQNLNVPHIGQQMQGFTQLIMQVFNNGVTTLGNQNFNCPQFNQNVINFITQNQFNTPANK